MKHRLLALLLITFALPALTLQAQEATPDVSAEGWPVIERCIGEPTTPPADWTFDGTILMDGRYGVHAYQSDWDTTRIVAFLRRSGEDLPLPGGALSPNGHWYAIPYGESYTTETYNRITIPRQIRVFDTTDVEAPLSIPWDAVFYGGGYGQLYWLNNEEFIYPQTGGISGVGVISVNIWDDQITLNLLAEPQNSDLTGMLIEASPQFSISPDGTTAIIGGSMYNLATSEVLATLPGTAFASAWTADGFEVAVIFGSGDLMLLDQNGNVIEKIITLPDNMQIQPENLVWSQDNRYLAFAVSPQYPSTASLYVADTLESNVRNLCLDLQSGLAWNSNGLSQMALSILHVGIGYLAILDMEAFTLYRSIQNGGAAVIGWRAGE